MNFPSNLNLGMGRNSREEIPRESIKSEPNMDPDNEGPMDLSMPRYSNRVKGPCSGNSYFSVVRIKGQSSYDVDINDQPIDYSKKYVETNSVNSLKSNYVPKNSLVLNKAKGDHRGREKTFSERESKTDPFGDYAETDLDQPTDYSLRYAEDDTDEDEKQSTAYFVGNEQEDTVKTYCTEGTPYETPFNFSTATSMSDLRIEDSKEVEGVKKNVKKVIQDTQNSQEIITTIVVKERIPASVEEQGDDEISTKDSKNITNEMVLNSTGVPIEKPVNYYDEGTPGIISRVSSLSSLGCVLVSRSEEVEEVGETNCGAQTTPALPVSPIPSVEGSREGTEDVEQVLVVGEDPVIGEDVVAGQTEEEKNDPRVIDKEGKMVTFGGEDHYAEQTPLMFSRCSSLGSLSGFEQQSIHDDRSSIVSDFSRRTSGIVSPSELPDSPTQTIPPSPRHNHKIPPNDFANRPPLRHFSYVKSPRTKSSVFEDNIAAFKEESTPIEFSAATSLSSLTIDDEPKITIDSKEKDYPDKARTVGRSAADNPTLEADGQGDRVENENEDLRDQENERDQEQVSDGDEDDEDILAACINMGMRNNRYRQSFKKTSDIVDKSPLRVPTETTTNLVRYQTSSTLDRLEVGATSSGNAASVLSPISKAKITMDVVAVSPDTVRVYCTEDTPADISPVGSQSNLSALSMPSISGDFGKDDAEGRNRLSVEDDDSWILSGDDEKILDECIRSGIPKARQTNNSNPSVAVIPEFRSPNNAPITKKIDSHMASPVDGLRTKSSLSMSISAEAVSTQNNRAISPVPLTIAANHDSNLYDDSPNHSDDEAILAECIQSAMPKGRIGSLPYVKSQPSRKTSEQSTKRTNMDDTASFSSSHVVTQVFHTSVTRITITETKNSEDRFEDSSSLSEEEEDLILAQCIRSGMPKASSVPPKDTNYERDERRSREE